MIEKGSIFKLIILSAIIGTWIVLIAGFIKVPYYVWLLLSLISILFYLSVTERSRFRKGKEKDVIKNMEDYLDRKAEEIDIEEFKESEQDE